VTSAGLPLHLQEIYNSFYSKLDPWRLPGERGYLPGQVLLSDEVCPFCLLKESRFFTDYLRSAGWAHAITTVISRAQDEAVVLTAGRDENSGPFDQAAKRRAEALAPYLIQASLVQEKCGTSSASQAFLNKYPMGLVFLSAEGRSLYTNRAAETIFEKKDGLLLRQGRVRAISSTTDTALQKAMLRILDPTPDGGVSEAMLINRKSTKRPYHVVISATVSEIQGLSHRTRAILTIADPDEMQNEHPSLFSRLYGMTSREAELTSKLCLGKTIEESAMELNITYHTARTHLRRIYDKTGTSRQTDLVLLLARLPQAVERG
jgi:DNA-binding CsgD family transcriptional regulator